LTEQRAVKSVFSGAVSKSKFLLILF